MRVAAGLRTLLPMLLALANVRTFLFIARISIFLGACMAWARCMVPRHRSTLVAELTLRMHWLEHPPPASAHCHLTIDIPPSPSQPATGDFARYRLQTIASQPNYVVSEEVRLDGVTKAFTGISTCPYRGAPKHRTEHTSHAPTDSLEMPVNQHTAETPVPTSRQAHYSARHCRLIPSPSLRSAQR